MREWGAPIRSHVAYAQLEELQPRLWGAVEDIVDADTMTTYDMWFAQHRARPLTNLAVPVARARFQEEMDEESDEEGEGDVDKDEGDEGAKDEGDEDAKDEGDEDAEEEGDEDVEDDAGDDDEGDEDEDAEDDAGDDEGGNSVGGGDSIGGGDGGADDDDYWEVGGATTMDAEGDPVDYTGRALVPVRVGPS